MANHDDHDDNDNNDASDADKRAEGIREFLMRFAKEACDKHYPVLMFSMAGPGNVIFLEHSLCKGVNRWDASIVLTVATLLKEHIEGPWFQMACTTATEMLGNDEVQELLGKIEEELEGNKSIDRLDEPVPTLIEEDN